MSQYYLYATSSQNATPWQGLWTLNANVDSHNSNRNASTTRYGLINPLAQRATSNPHPLTSSLLAAEFALLVLMGLLFSL
jgi:hypothetical protein